MATENTLFLSDFPIETPIPIVDVKLPRSSTGGYPSFSGMGSRPQGLKVLIIHNISRWPRLPKIGFLGVLAPFVHNNLWL